MIIKITRTAVRLFEMAIVLKYRMINSFMRATCFFIGHSTQYSYDDYEPFWCNRCFSTEEQLERFTIPCYLNVVYHWLVEREWKWFGAFDLWVIEHFKRHLPKWWSY